MRFPRSFAVLATVALIPLAPATAAPLAILPLGDSITQGGKKDREEYTYRYPLFGLLTDAGVEFDFIGSMNKGLQPEATWPDYKGKPMDLDHEGHYGWKTAAVRDKLPEWMPKWQAAPDIVLIHLGTNDQKSKDFQRDIADPLADMIRMIREKNPKAVFLVSHLNFNGEPAVSIRKYVDAMAAKMNTPESPVVTVAMYEGFQADPKKPNPDTFDWAHPNPQGQRKMAEKWFAAMQPYLRN